MGKPSSFRVLPSILHLWYSVNILCRYNGNKFQRCTTEIFAGAGTKKGKDESEEDLEGCERERLPRRRQGGSRAPVQSRTVSKDFLKWFTWSFFKRLFAHVRDEQQQQQQGQGCRHRGVLPEETGFENHLLLKIGLKNTEKLMKNTKNYI